MCRRSDVADPSSMVDVVDLALGLGSAPIASDVSSNVVLWRNAELYELQGKYDCLVEHLKNIKSE